MSVEEQERWTQRGSGVFTDDECDEQEESDCEGKRFIDEIRFSGINDSLNVQVEAYRNENCINSINMPRHMLSDLASSYAIRKKVLFSRLYFDIDLINRFFTFCNIWTETDAHVEVRNCTFTSVPFVEFNEFCSVAFATPSLTFNHMLTPHNGENREYVRLVTMPFTKGASAVTFELGEQSLHSLSDIVYATDLLELFQNGHGCKSLKMTYKQIGDNNLCQFLEGIFEKFTSSRMARSFELKITDCKYFEQKEEFNMYTNEVLQLVYEYPHKLLTLLRTVALETRVYSSSNDIRVPSFTKQTSSGKHQQKQESQLNVCDNRSFRNAPRHSRPRKQILDHRRHQPFRGSHGFSVVGASGDDPFMPKWQDPHTYRTPHKPVWVKEKEKPKTVGNIRKSTSWVALAENRVTVISRSVTPSSDSGNNEEQEPAKEVTFRNRPETPETDPNVTDGSLEEKEQTFDQHENSEQNAVMVSMAATESEDNKVAHEETDTDERENSEIAQKPNFDQNGFVAYLTDSFTQTYSTLCKQGRLTEAIDLKQDLTNLMIKYERLSVFPTSPLM